MQALVFLSKFFPTLGILYITKRHFRGTCDALFNFLVSLPQVKSDRLRQLPSCQYRKRIKFDFTDAYGYGLIVDGN